MACFVRSSYVMNVLSSEVSIKYSDIDDALYGDMYSDTEDELAEEATKIVVAILFLLDSVRYSNKVFDDF